MNLFELLNDRTEDAIERFVDAWHGPASPAPRLPDGRFPVPIRRLAGLAEARPRILSQNHLVDDPEWARDGDRRVFYIENQSVYLWATDSVGPDPVVWGRFDEPGEGWEAEREPLSRFLLQLVAFEAIMGAPCGAAAATITLPQLEAVVRPLQRLPWGAWRWPSDPSTFYAGHDVLAFGSVGPWEAVDHFDIMFAALTPEPLAYLREIEGIPWDQEPG